MIEDLEIPEVPDRPRDLTKKLDQRRVDLEMKLEELNRFKKMLTQKIRETETELSHIKALIDPTARVGFERQLSFGRRAPKIDQEIYTRFFDEALKDCGEEIGATKMVDFIHEGLQKETEKPPTLRSLQNKARQSLRDLADAGLIEMDVTQSRGREKVYRPLRERVSLRDMNREDDLNILDMEE